MPSFNYPLPKFSHQIQLNERGFVVLENTVEKACVSRLVDEVERLWSLEGNAAGAEFKQEPNTRRLANLVDKSSLFRDVVEFTPVLSLMQHVLGDFKLSSLNARSANPFALSGQPLHCDGGYLPDRLSPLVANAVWCLDDFTSRNGSLRVVPGSHLYRQLPEVALDDPTAPHPDEITVEASAGSLIVINAHLWHSGMDNQTEQPRRALHAYYCRRDQPQQQFQQRMLSEQTQAKATPRLRHILALDDSPLPAENYGSNSVSGFLD